jgi:bis(5'-nucleosyl)-tetraphosphatase (symmetrical)
MATYVIGDIHGCYETLLSLLDKIAYDKTEDRLWMVGDLVNNGPRNAEVIRWAMEQGDRLVCVLGNHDLHMLAAAHGVRPMRKKDTFQDVLDAPDSRELLRWMRYRPMLHQEGDDVMVHAGLLPEWDIELATSCARELEAVLRDDDNFLAFFEQMYGNEPLRWSDDLKRTARLRLTVNAMTRMRAVTRKEGNLEYKYKGTLAGMPEQLVPWFERADAIEDVRLFFGHWSAIGYHCHESIHAMDAGVTWGNELMAMRLEDEAQFHVPTIEGEEAKAATLMKARTQ